MLRDRGTRLHAWECKSGMTYVPEWVAGLVNWGRLAAKKAGALHLVYGGNETFIRHGIRVLSWKDVGAKAM